MKKIFKALMVVGMMAGSVNAMAAGEVQSACHQAFEGKCFHGDQLVLTDVETAIQAEGFCVSNPNFCGFEECVARVKIIRGLAVSAGGNPCD